MPTEIRFLQNLERDLTKIAQTEKRQTRSDVTQRRHALLRGWLTAAAVFVLIAFVIGLASLTGHSSSYEFSTLGSAVNGAGGGDGGFSVGSSGAAGAQDQGTAPQPVVPSASPAASSGAGGVKTDLTKIVRDGAISLSIGRGQFGDVSTQVVAVARRNGGEVLSSTTSKGTSGTFTLRIPAAHFEKAMAELAALGVVDSSESSGQDVTAQYLDAQAHLKILYARRAFLFGLMAKATTQAESLTAQRELEQTQLEIDKITGQLRYLNNQVTISTIKVDVHEPGAAPIDQPADAVQNPSLGRAFARSMHGLLTVLGAIVIGIGYMFPLLVLAAITYGVVWLVRRRRRSGDAS